MCSKCLPPARTQARRRWRHSPTARWITAWLWSALRPTHCWCVVSVRRRPRSWCDRLVPEAHSARCSQPGWGITIIFWSRRMRYPVWIHCCKRPNYDIYITQGSVATVLRWGGQNYSYLRQVSSRCCMPKIINFGQCFFSRSYSKNNTGTVFFETRCTYWRPTDDQPRISENFEWPYRGSGLSDPLRVWF